MSNTNYDVELDIAYDNAHRHYIPTYHVAVPYYRRSMGPAETYPYWVSCRYDVFVSFDEGQESDIPTLWYKFTSNPDDVPPVPFWNDSQSPSGEPFAKTLIEETGVFSKVYLRNPNRNLVTFTKTNCFIEAQYVVKADFEIQWNSTGFAANSNPVFRCSTIQKNTYKQYEWTSATVYYKRSTDSTYSSVTGIVSGTWSDVQISTSITLSDSYTYDVYIRAVSDDGSVATTPVAQFTTTDATAVATCISPVGAFLQGTVNFVWSHSTAYGTPQYAYDLQYSSNNGSTWTTVANHVVTTNTTKSITLSDAGSYKWRVRTYNSNNVAGDWAEASFVNNVPANPPTNLSVNTKGRPTVSWASVSQSAYQVQFLLGDSIVYDSGAVYTSETSHFVNQYFNDERSYNVRVRIYNALGEVSEWVSTGYQQPTVTDVEFTVEALDEGGVLITVVPSDVFIKYFVLRNNKLIGQIEGDAYTDNYASGQINYSVVGVTSEDQSDIQTQGVRALYPCATLIAQNGQAFAINKRVDEAFQIQTSNQADINKAEFIGDEYSVHYPSNLRFKSFTASLFDDNGITEDLLGTLVYYADNFGNGGWCMVTAYEKTDNFIQNSRGVYANEVSLTLEVTNYDDSIEYPI